ncbi:sigma-54-dependent transcriptional regulator [Thalassospira alkalitolerans]|uniref:Fis family transcriptional regulator n=1 Tax=Thalassospira alkalitolerans TaxID=1293890 RepID=A0A1Y2LC38_9PROT|nr:sigma-54 dependent transcriptional regulator [Thalassospira alkalitolerans]OSQ47983.1 Fis family transcriptional regulator [Thalassospira alkalitolerans]
MNNSAHCVLFVDDDEDVREAAQQTLELADIIVECHSEAGSALDRIRRGWPGVLVSDIRMPRMDGMELLSQVRKIEPEMPVILVTGHGDVATAVRAMRDGAFDFIEKPFSPDHFVDVARRAMAHRQLILENRTLKAELARHSKEVSGLIGRTPAMEKLRTLIGNIAATDAHVLINGETGSGKEVVARTLHEASGRKGPFVAVNCGAMPENLIESELFGHEAGAFTGAENKRIGKFEFADKGTMFLDEIESMPLSLQVKLLRVLQERALERLGSNKLQPIDLRVVAATKVDLRDASSRGAFREDLYYRLNVVQLHIPPLRDRKDDIPLLFQHFMKQAQERFGREFAPLNGSEIARLTGHDWPGNVRELRNAAERRVLGLDPFAGDSAQTIEHVASLPQQVEAFEKGIINEALRQHGGHVTATVNALGVPRKTFYDKLAKYGIVPAEFRSKTDS